MSRSIGSHSSDESDDMDIEEEEEIEEESIDREEVSLHNNDIGNGNGISSRQNMNVVDDEEDDEGEDLMGDTMFDDYVAIPELDTYDLENLAPEEENLNTYEEELSARQRAEAAIRARDRNRARNLDGIKYYFNSIKCYLINDLIN